MNILRNDTIENIENYPGVHYLGMAHMQLTIALIPETDTPNIFVRLDFFKYVQICIFLQMQEVCLEFLGRKAYLYTTVTRKSRYNFCTDLRFEEN